MQTSGEQVNTVTAMLRRKGAMIQDKLADRL
jgi:hypothetical protein